MTEFPDIRVSYRATDPDLYRSLRVQEPFIHRNLQRHGQHSFNSRHIFDLYFEWGSMMKFGASVIIASVTMRIEMDHTDWTISCKSSEDGQGDRVISTYGNGQHLHTHHIEQSAQYTKHNLGVRSKQPSTPLRRLFRESALQYICERLGC